MAVIKSHSEKNVCNSVTSTQRALPANSELGWKRLTVTNALTYFTTELITGVKGFIV